MAAPRKNPPSNAAEIIHQLASSGIANIGIAKHFNVSKETLKRWLDDYENLQEAFEQGRETERQALHAAVYRDAMASKPANVNAFFLLKARFGYRDNDPQNVNVGVNVASPCMAIHVHGTDAEWEAKAAAQQSSLIGGSQPVAILAPPQQPTAPQVGAVTIPAYAAPPAPFYAAPAWSHKT